MFASKGFVNNLTDKMCRLASWIFFITIFPLFIPSIFKTRTKNPNCTQNRFFTLVETLNCLDSIKKVRILLFSFNRNMKLYAVCDGPPSLAVRMTLKHLKVPFELVEVNFNEGAHLTDEYAKVKKFLKLIVEKKFNQFFVAVESSKGNSGFG